MIFDVLDAWDPPKGGGGRESASLTARAASLLNHAAEKCPGAYLTWPYVTKLVLGVQRMPRVGGSDVVTMTRRAAGIRLVLQRDYGRDLVSVLGIGIRATADPEDASRMRAGMRRFT